LYTFCVLGLCPFALFNEILLIKKKNSMEALRPTQGVVFLSLLSSDPAEKAVVVLSVQDKGKSPSLVRKQLSVSTPVVKEGASTLGSPTAIKGEVFRVNGLTQSFTGGGRSEQAALVGGGLYIMIVNS
jgi:hypothetical protein